MATMTTLHFTGDENANRFISTNPHLVTHHHGDAAAVWRHAVDGQALFRDVRALPGFGDQKARVFVALLGKQLGVRPAGWEAVAGSYGLPGHRSVADVTDRESLDRVRTYKPEHRRADVEL